MATRRWLLGTISALILLAGCQQKPTPPPLPVKQLMAGHVQRDAQLYWDAVSTIMDEKGTHEIFPRNDAEWDRTRAAAERLKGYGELLQLPAYAEGRNEDWRDFAEGLSTIAAQAEAAAVAKNSEKVLDVGGNLYNVCAACHQVYLPKDSATAANAPGAGS